jgi:Ca2+-binding RTX toxin-like protein
MVSLWANQTRINSATGGAQDGPVTVGLTDGRSVVVWRDLGTSAATLKYEIQNGEGAVVRAEAVLNTSTTGNIGVAGRAEVQVAALSDGGFVAAWNYRSGGNDDIRYRVFNQDGTPRTIELTAANTANTEFKPTVTGINNGGFVIAWERVNYDATPGNPADANITAILSTTYDSSGVPVVGQADILRSDLRGGDGNPSVAYTSTIGLNFVWEDSFGPNTTTPNAGIWGAEAGASYRADAAPGAPSSVSTDPEVAYSGTNFLAAWSRFTPISGQNSVEASINGGGVFQVNTTPLNSKSTMTPQVVGLKDGNFLVLWADGGSTNGADIGGNDHDVIGRVVSSAGGFVSAEFVVTDAGTINNNLNSLDATVLLDGRVLVTWEAGGPSTSGVEIYSRIVDTRTVALNWGGTSGNEEYAGTTLGDNLSGGAGNDIIAGGAGADTLDGSAGTSDFVAYNWDQRAGGTNGVYVNLQAGVAIDTGGAVDILSAFEGIVGTDNPYPGGYWSDFLLGDNNANTIYGLGGNDYIVGGYGIDYLSGGGGTDWFILNGEIQAGSYDFIADFNVGGNGDYLALSAAYQGLTSFSDYAGYGLAYINFGAAGGYFVLAAGVTGAQLQAQTFFS